jgi:spermidine/putrescine transport system ATP-binding protein
MAAEVRLDDVTIQFGAFTAVHRANLTINGGEFFSILGPSGCGKTTLLRAISGFIEPTNGAIYIGGDPMAGIGPNLRPTALIFQNLALFPLMTVAENVGYGLRVRGMPRAERERKVDELLHLVALPDQGRKRVSELSGGQKQRIAIARALAVEPKVLLLDEPLSALDLRLRQHMRNELRAIQQRVGITFVYITHDQGEALTMSDRVAVMNAGVIEQVGDSRAVYDRPSTRFVASFVGENNGFDGRVISANADEAAVETRVGILRGRPGASISAGAEATVFVRPERWRLAATGDDGAIEAVVTAKAFEGSATQLFLKGPFGVPITILLSRREDGQDIAPGATVRLAYAIGDAVVLAAGAGR